MSLEHKENSIHALPKNYNTKMYIEETNVEAANHNLIEKRKMYMCHTIIHEVTIVLD